MATNYPTSIDNATSLPYPSSTDDTNNPSLAGLQDNQNDAVIAVQSLVGTNSSQTTPSGTSYVLQAVSTTASNWGLLTSANVTYATGSGPFVFGTSPTITSPLLNSPTIAGATFTGSLGGITTSTITASGLITGNSGLLINGAVSLPTNSITAPELSTSAITLGYAQITGNITTTSTTQVQVTGLTASVTIPAGGRKVKITAFAQVQLSNSPKQVSMTLWSGTVGSGTQLQSANLLLSATTVNGLLFAQIVITPSAGPATYNVGWASDGGGGVTATMEAGATNPAFILVEAI